MTNLTVGCGANMCEPETKGGRGGGGGRKEPLSRSGGLQLCMKTP
jgi:hypothetical protein